MSARADLCGGRSAMVVPTATLLTQQEAHNLACLKGEEFEVTTRTTAFVVIAVLSCLALSINLPAQADGDAGQEIKERLPFWADPATGLTWAKKDNGSDASWAQANEYCGNLTLGGRSGWRLPTIAELGGIFDQTKAGQKGLHPKGGIRLSWPGIWSSTQGNSSDEKWAFSFHNGSRSSSKLGPSNFNRALCVRRSGE